MFILLLLSRILKHARSRYNLYVSNVVLFASKLVPVLALQLLNQSMKIQSERSFSVSIRQLCMKLSDQIGPCGIGNKILASFSSPNPMECHSILLTKYIIKYLTSIILKLLSKCYFSNRYQQCHNKVQYLEQMLYFPLQICTSSLHYEYTSCKFKA